MLFHVIYGFNENVIVLFTFYLHLRFNVLLLMKADPCGFLIYFFFILKTNQWFDFKCVTLNKRVLNSFSNSNEFDSVSIGKKSTKTKQNKKAAFHRNQIP